MRQTKNKRIKTIQPNLYGLGSEIRAGWKNASTSSKVGAGLGLASGAIGALAGGKETTAGNAISGLGNIASAIPGIGAIAGPALSAIGGLTNAMFGSKMNDQFIAETESNINNQKNYQVDAQDSDAFRSEFGDINKLAYVSKSQVGSDGLFSSKAARKTRNLNAQIDSANASLLSAFENRAQGIDTQKDLTIAANFKADGGNIHIKKANRGKFTDYCGGKVTQECITRGKNSPSATIRKRATFADNARQWHAFGGELGTNGAIWSNGVNYFNTGGTHEENPNEGIPQGADENGAPNLVEQGEVKYDNYIFSNRIKAKKDLLLSLGLSPSTQSYADIAKKISKESEERPNDPISKNGLENNMTKLRVAQELQRQSNKQENNKFDRGGNLSLQDRLKYSSTKHTDFSDLTNINKTVGNVLHPQSSYLNPPTLNSSSTRKVSSTASKPSWLRYAPALGGAVGAMTNALTPVDKPDYREADSIMNARQTVNYTPLTERLEYKPFDRDYYTNKLNAQSGATRRSLANASGGNRATLMAGLINAGYNTEGQLGELFRKAEEYNQAQREKVTGFNRETDAINAQLALQANTVNSQSRLQAAQLAASLRQAEGQRYREDYQAKAEAIGANVSNFLDSLGNIGRENYISNQIQSMVDSGILKVMPNGDGTFSYVPVKKSKGGKLKIKL